MAEFIHLCHKAKVASGELKRLTSSVEAYLDLHGKVALTPQNHKLFHYGDQTITPEQKLSIRRGIETHFGNHEKT